MELVDGRSGLVMACRGLAWRDTFRRGMVSQGAARQGFFNAIIFRHGSICRVKVGQGPARLSTARHGDARQGATQGGTRLRVVARGKYRCGRTGLSNAGPVLAGHVQVRQREARFHER